MNTKTKYKGTVSGLYHRTRINSGQFNFFICWSNKKARVTISVSLFIDVVSYLHGQGRPSTRVIENQVPITIGWNLGYLTLGMVASRGKVVTIIRSRGVFCVEVQRLLNITSFIAWDVMVTASDGCLTQRGFGGCLSIVINGVLYSSGDLMRNTASLLGRSVTSTSCVFL